MVEKREIWLCIVLSIVTCGIYGFYWMYKINDEINYLANDASATSGGMVIVLALVTCGIYTWYWMYKMGDQLDIASTANGLPAQSRGIIYLLLTFFGLGIISYALMQDSVNKLADVTQGYTL